MRVRKDVKALSTLITVLLILIFTIIGAFISYMWVMASYYNMPETSTSLVIENAVFSPSNFTYFNLTVLNPSNSVLDVNITGFRLTVEGTNESYVISTAEPALPFTLNKGTIQNFTCTTNWSNFAGETVKIEPVANDAATTLFPCTTPTAKLLIYGFNNSQRIEYFNLTVENSPESEMNLTISALMIEGSSTYTTPLLPIVLAPSQLQTFICRFNWGTMMGENITITVNTEEGYQQTYETSQIETAIIYISDVKFDYTDTSYFNLTLTSLESTVDATLDSVNITLPTNMTITLDTIPTLKLVPIPVPANGSRTLKCLWNWTDLRNQTFTVNVYTKVGFEISSLTPTTPPAVIWSVDSVNFDLDDLQHFSVNITNWSASLQQINITKVEFNQNLTTTSPTLIAIGEQATVSCGFNWTDSVGEGANVTIYAVYGSNESVTEYHAVIPYLKLVNTSFSNFELGNPYMNVTLYNSQFSKVNVTIAQVFVKTDNGTFTIDGTISNPKTNSTEFTLTTGTRVTIVCPWDWGPFVGKEVTVVVQTADGLQVSMTLIVQ